MTTQPPFETWLQRLSEGDELARSEWTPRVSEELRKLAIGIMRGQPSGHTLQATELIGEAYLRLFGRGRLDCVDHEHFLRLASRVMRQVLVDHARKKHAVKRSAPTELTAMDLLVDSYEENSGSLVDLDLALEKLEARDPELVQIVELHFFGGNTVPETARLLGLSERTAARRLQVARTLLKGELST